MNLSINFEDFDKMCRICLQFVKTLVPISANDIFMIKACASVNIWINDELPNQICQVCLSRLQDSFNFKRLCEKSDTDLRRVIAEYKKNKQQCDESTVLIKNELNTDDNAQNCNGETFSFKTEETFADDEVDDYNDDTFSLKNEDDIKKENIQETESNVPENNKGAKEPVTCEKCDRKFRSLFYLGVHCKSTHKAQGTKCRYCTAICYHPLHLEAHERFHTDPPHKCEHCGQAFMYKTRYTRHLYKHTTDRPLKCPQCDLYVKYQAVLDKHIAQVHNTVSKPCHICGKTFRNLQRHLLTHGEREMVECHICKKQLTKHSLEYHIKRIHEKAPPKRRHLCTVCGIGTSCITLLQAHMRTHTGEKPFKCDRCDKKYANKSQLKIHVSRVHLSERNHICSVCSRGFYDRPMLVNHMRTHTGERPFKCPICERTFSFEVSKKTHMKLVHKVHKVKSKL